MREEREKGPRDTNFRHQRRGNPGKQADNLGLSFKAQEAGSRCFYLIVVWIFENRVVSA